MGGHVACMGVDRNMYEVLTVKLDGEGR
jgi:hypothetical protein